MSVNTEKLNTNSCKFYTEAHSLGSLPDCHDVLDLRLLVTISEKDERIFHFLATPNDPRFLLKLPMLLNVRTV